MWFAPDRASISKQKRGKALQRILAAEHEKLILGAPEPKHGKAQEFAHDIYGRAGEVRKSVPFEGHDLDGHHGFGRSVMDLVGLEAEHLARHMERADLPASVGQKLGDADHARQHLVDITRRLALGVNLGVTPEAHHHANGANDFGRAGLRRAETAKWRFERLVAERRSASASWFLPEEWACLTQISTPRAAEAEIRDKHLREITELRRMKARERANSLRAPVIARAWGRFTHGRLDGLEQHLSKERLLDHLGDPGRLGAGQHPPRLGVPP